MLGWREAQRGHQGIQRRASSHMRPEEDGLEGGGLEKDEGGASASEWSGGVGQTPPAQVLPGPGIGACGRFRKPRVAQMGQCTIGRAEGQRWRCRSCRGLERRTKDFAVDALRYAA